LGPSSSGKEQDFGYGTNTWFLENLSPKLTPKNKGAEILKYVPTGRKELAHGTAHLL